MTGGMIMTIARYKTLGGVHAVLHVHVHVHMYTLCNLSTHRDVQKVCEIRAPLWATGPTLAEERAGCATKLLFNVDL